MRRRLLVSLATLLLMLLLGEGVVRVRQYVKYGTTGQRYHRLVEHEASGLMIPAPGGRTGDIVVNEQGFRNPAIPPEKPEGTIRLAFLGGSTTFCAEVSSNEVTWPHLVVETLAEAHPEVRFDYINGGAAGYTTKESLLNLQYRVAPLEPDVLVVYHGTNDLVHESRRIATERGKLTESAAEQQSWLAERSMLWFLLQKNLRFRERQAQAAAGSSGMPLEAGEIGAPFRTKLEALLDEARESARLTVLPTFATRARGDQSARELQRSVASAIYYMPYFLPEEVLAGYREVNETIRAVAAERDDVILVEGEDAIPGDDAHFADTVHFLDPGAVLQAERVSAALLADPAFQALCAEIGGG